MKHLFFTGVISVLLLTIVSCTPKAETKIPQGPTEEELELQRLEQERLVKEEAVSAYLESLTEAERIGLLFLVNIEGDKTYSAVEKYDGLDLVPGGCLLFSFNIAKTDEQFMTFIDSIYEYCQSHDIQSFPYIALDQEGGYVNRLRALTSTLPAAQWVSQKATVQQAFDLYDSQAKQMRLLGITMNLAPVAEVETDDNAQFLDTRSYGSLEQVNQYARSCVNAYEQNQVLSVLKHFPGNTNVDPHSGLPEIIVESEQEIQNLIKPFETLVFQTDVSAVLMSHARVSLPDAQTPSCLSSFWVNDCLRKTLGFEGLVLSDDIFMAALEKNGFAPLEAAEQALLSGVDIIMLSEKRFAAVAKQLASRAEQNPALADRIAQAQQNVVRYKIKCGLLTYVQNEDGSYCVQNAFSYEDLKDSRLVRLTQFREEKKRGQNLYAAILSGEQE
ncbi:MAG: glycoside hydrolase family 3 protein [Treponema sp.]|nr:glycoside hydrolase family 3 protein [Treponema sp.]